MVVVGDMGGEDADGVEVVLVDEPAVVLGAGVALEVIAAEDVGNPPPIFFRIDEHVDLVPLVFVVAGDDLDSERVLGQFLEAAGAHATAADGAETDGTWGGCHEKILLS